MLGQTMYNYV